VVADHPDALTYRRTADAFRAGDFGLLEELIAPDVVWHVPGEHRMAGDLRGREAVITWLTEVRGLGFWLEEHDVFASDQHVCAVSTMGARREGVDVQTRVVHLFCYRQGQQVERWFYPDDQNAWDRIFGR
jgi:uncharacterized protein